MEDLNIQFDPEIDGLSAKIIGGVFPAHIVGWEEGSEWNNSTPCNVVYRIAPEAADAVGRDLDTGEEAKGLGMVGQDVKSSAIWLCPKPPKGEGWRNRGYVEFADSVGIKFPEVEDKTTGKTTLSLQKLEKLDVLGLPVMIQIGHQVHKEDKEKPVVDQRKYPRAFKTFAWEEGERLDIDELLIKDEEELDPFAGV